MNCAIDDNDCLGEVEMVDLLGGDVPLCEYHLRDVGNLGERAFEEWYSIELEDARKAA